MNGKFGWFCFFCHAKAGTKAAVTVTANGMTAGMCEACAVKFGVTDAMAKAA